MHGDMSRPDARLTLPCGAIRSYASKCEWLRRSFPARGEGFPLVIACSWFCAASRRVGDVIRHMLVLGVRRRLRHFTHTIFHDLHARRARAPIRDSGAVSFRSSILRLPRLAPSAAQKCIFELTRRQRGPCVRCRRWRDHGLVSCRGTGVVWREVPSPAGGREARRRSLTKGRDGVL